ncbi:MAG: hypothetical protein CMP48_16095 [Rickettsiales bacterium]|nr:hypothetical protein [Rickettsiales bacterium]
MISEKTVELNLTTELVNWNFHITGTRPYILAPSQRQEGKLGFDVSIGYPGSNPTLIQYKRAYHKKRKGELEFHLNRNTNQDQHLRLFILELLGHDVFYALPLFYQPSDVIRFRRRLLVRTLFLKPSWIIPVGGLTGHHEIKYNLKTKKLTVFSEEGKEIDRFFDFFDFAREVELRLLDRQRGENRIERFLTDFNNVFAGPEGFRYEEFRIGPVSEQEQNLTDSMNVLIN